MKRPTPWIAAVTLVLLVLEGCMYLPRTTTAYDDTCRIERRHMTLEVQQIATIAGCSNESCVAALVLFGVVTAASAVVSGSVVLVGNVVYWIEAQGACLNNHSKQEVEREGTSASSYP